MVSFSENLSAASSAHANPTRLEECFLRASELRNHGPRSHGPNPFQGISSRDYAGEQLLPGVLTIAQTMTGHPIRTGIFSILWTCSTIGWGVMLRWKSLVTLGRLPFKPIVLLHQCVQPKWTSESATPRCQFKVASLNSLLVVACVVSGHSASQLGSHPRISTATRNTQSRTLPRPAFTVENTPPNQAIASSCLMAEAQTSQAPTWGWDSAEFPVGSPGLQIQQAMHEKTRMNARSSDCQRHPQQHVLLQVPKHGLLHIPIEEVYNQWTVAGNLKCGVSQIHVQRLDQSDSGACSDAKLNFSKGRETNILG